MIRIVIAEEQQMMLSAIGSLLSLEEDMEVVGQANSGEDAISLVHQMQPDVCIIDIDMPQKSGLEVAEALKDLDCKVIILTTFARAGYVKRALMAGVWGYLLKDSPSEALAKSIRHVVAGDLVYEPQLLEETKIEETLILEQERFININFQQQVKSYISTIMDKIKQPTA
jgi:two-component system, NarL family, response regulator DesR